MQTKVCAPIRIMSVYERLESLERIGIKLGLRNIKVILEALGQPQNSFRSILIAGTNGKGSTGAMLESILRKQGFKTGYYTSPHLIDIRERIQINRQLITQQEFEAILTKVFEAVDSMIALARLETPPTYFEILTASSFLHFQQTKVDIAVVEVGLGGRFDATNVLPQNISVITSIDYDHEEFLGKSLAQIAFEKAGIFKSGIPVVCGPLPSEAAETIQEVAARLNCQIFQFEPSAIQNLNLMEGFPVFRYNNLPIQVNLRGRHQVNNAGVALTVCEKLRTIDIEISEKAMIEGLNKVEWPGRLDLLQRDPDVLLDCAHNPMGVRALAEFLKEFGWNEVVALFTAMKDKKIPGMLIEIAPLINHMVLTRVQPSTRCATQDQLAKACEDEKIPWEFEENTASALELALQRARENGHPLLIFGSIYLAGEILKSYRQNVR
jgi:dihydrofolate synthase / folylpolyglutamate synthase